MKRVMSIAISLASLFLTGPLCTAHENSAHDSSARYIANEGLLAQSGDVKILFDPFQVSGFGTYQEPRSSDLADLMAGQSAFSGIDAVFISHAHQDHFSAPQMIAYLKAQSGVHLIAPQQALEMMQAEPNWDTALTARMTILNMDYGDAPQSISLSGIEATAVRIAHAGWPAPRRVTVQNMVYRVTLDGAVTFMHMGDADPNAVHFAPFADHWRAKITDTAFPPYWFLTSAQGQRLLRDINIQRAIGVHVPIVVPQDLIASGADYFSVLGESLAILKGQSHD